jgi:cell division protease FtsH
MNKRWKNVKLFALIGFALLTVGIPVSSAVFLANNPPNLPQSPMSYGEFIQAVEAKQIQRVVLTPDRATAVVTKGAERYQVNLPNDPNLIDKLSKHNVDITVRPPQEKQGILQRLMLSLLVPLFVAGALIVWLCLLLIWLQSKMGR